ncbi:hypothetical protein [Nesterenkonia sp. CF4.4]|uniref:hypothetical protein n=1 Tax=Nesterenkonia sp. CF4.4 TaxID=3373079 RepID=UPI003EE7F4D5
MIFSRAAHQLDEAAQHYDQAAMRLDAVAERGEDCVRAVFAAQEGVAWQSPAGRAFTLVTFHHVQEARRRQSRLFEMSASARLIADDLREQAHLARVLAAALEAALDGGVGGAVDAGIEGAAAAGGQTLVQGAREASQSAEGFLRFVQSHGGLPLARLTEGLR